MPGVEVWLENFGAEGALMASSGGPGSGDLDLDGNNLIDAGYGYEWNNGTEHDWSRETRSGAWTVPGELPRWEKTPVFGEWTRTDNDAYFSGLELNSHWMGWQSWSISMQDAQGAFGKLALQVHIEGVSVGLADEVQVNVLAADSLYSGSEYGGEQWGQEGLGQDVLSDLMDAPETVQLEIRAVNDGAGEEWRV